MSIAQNLKLLNMPIAKLAMLPQDTIMQMAQMGQIPVAYVAPILEVKAEQAQTGAEIAAMAAQEQMPPGTEIERIIAQNAANEAKAAMPEMQMPEDSGIAALPVDEGMVPEYAGGGIVAFKEGDFVENSYSEFDKDIEALARQREKFLGANQSVADLLAYNKEAEARAEARARQQMGARILQAGLLGLGGDSPYAFQNLGKMAPAVEGYMGDVEKQEAAKEARRKSELEAKGAVRAEKEKTFSQALQERQVRDRLVPEDIRKARAIQEEARAAKKPVPTLAQALKSIERTPQTTTLEAAYVRAKADAAEAVGKLVNSSVFNAEVRSIEKKQGKAAAEEYKRRRIAETVALYPGVDPASVMASIGGGGAPSSAPSGTVDKNNPLLR